MANKHKTLHDWAVKWHMNHEAVTAAEAAIATAQKQRSDAMQAQLEIEHEILKIVEEGAAPTPIIIAMNDDSEEYVSIARDHEDELYMDIVRTLVLPPKKEQTDG